MKFEKIEIIHEFQRKRKKDFFLPSWPALPFGPIGPAARPSLPFLSLSLSHDRAPCVSPHSFFLVVMCRSCTFGDVLVCIAARRASLHRTLYLSSLAAESRTCPTARSGSLDPDRAIGIRLAKSVRPFKSWRLDLDRTTTDGRYLFA